MDGDEGLDWGEIAASETARAHLEQACRVEWPRLWLAVDAIAWIISRNADEVGQLLVASLPADGSVPQQASEVVADIAARYPHRGLCIGNTLFWARDQLATALCNDRLSGWRWNKIEGNLCKLPPESFFKALTINDTNSAGMFRMDSVANITDFLLLLHNEVRELWPADENNFQTPMIDANETAEQPRFSVDCPPSAPKAQI